MITVVWAFFISDSNIKQKEHNLSLFIESSDELLALFYLSQIIFIHNIARARHSFDECECRGEHSQPDSGKIRWCLFIFAWCIIHEARERLLFSEKSGAFPNRAFFRRIFLALRNYHEKLISLRNDLWPRAYTIECISLIEYFPFFLIRSCNFLSETQRVAQEANGG